jgi:hypothetical protein
LKLDKNVVKIRTFAGCELYVSIWEPTFLIHLYT